MKLTGADIVIETLIEQGVTDVFGYPGGQVINIYDAIYKRSDRLNHILTAHEQGASHAADGYSRATGKVGVVIATSGPGATNLVTGIATAYLDSVPMLAITGNVFGAQIGTDSFQEIDITGITLPITKHNYFVTSVEDLADTIREALVLAKSGRPGPVLIDIPKNVQVAKCEYEPQPPVTLEEKHAAKDIRITEAAACINACERPFIYFGGGVRISVDKRIPMGAGLAGGSADAAAVLRGLNVLYGQPLSSLELSRVGLTLGSDVPFCLVGGTCIARGRGELLERMPEMPDCAMVIAIGDDHVSTPSQFAELDRRFDNFSAYKPKAEKAQNIGNAFLAGSLDIADELYNIFEITGRFSPKIKETMLACGASGVLMSGSGSSVFGIFSDDGSAAIAEKELKAKGYRAFSCRPIKSDI